MSLLCENVLRFVRDSVLYSIYSDQDPKYSDQDPAFEKTEDSDLAYEFQTAAFNIMLAL
jgi:hypothetical protein